MIELAQHIEVLLLENDCVIVPGLGGFVAHYTPAMRVAEENVFLPPTRIIGFNPQLKMNDGLLVQSYMAVYDTDFSDATRIVEKEVAYIFTTLHEEGRVDLPNIGELRYSIHGTYDFAPYDHKITTPYLYGLDSFEMQELAELKKPYMEKTIRYSVPVVPEDKKRKFEFKFNRSYLSNAVAMIAVVALFFFLSTPIENTEVVEGNYAQLLPNELFEMIEKESLAINPIVVSRKADTPQASAQKNTGRKSKKRVVPVAVREVKVGQANAQNAPVVSQPKQQAAEVSSSTSVTTKSEVQKTTAGTVAPSFVSAQKYHVIIASVGTEKDAEAMAKQLIEKGYPHAKAIVGDGKMRVSIESCGTETEAYQALNRVRQNETYKNAWVLKK
ncbi:MAG: SPOR domain-containing protein [Bacteroides sp.]|uniref:HU domain-containing protein n=1 Tax=Bacteroides sp. TaxID=29523 RepID=UPI0026DF61F8|nr:SPOR domain-containing protein [Bacteroides sp.]MDO5419718.1 SPOR domain-containing protein [Bacteroides sp.]